MINKQIILDDMAIKNKLFDAIIMPAIPFWEPSLCQTAIETSTDCM